MKVFKRNNKLNKNEDYEIEKRFNTELNEIKEKLNSEKLSEEFKANLNAKLEEELNKTEDSNKGKIIKFPSYSKKLAGICACIIFLFSSCFTFADDIENIVLKIFSNTDKNIKTAIEKGNYKEIKMDYVEDNGVSIKVDYVIVEEDNLYVAFNVLYENEFDKVFFEDLTIKDKNGILIYKENDMESDKEKTIELKYVNKIISKNNRIIICLIENIDKEKINMLNIDITQLFIINHKIKIEKIGKWNFNI